MFLVSSPAKNIYIPNIHNYCMFQSIPGSAQFIYLHNYSHMHCYLTGNYAK